MYLLGAGSIAPGATAPNVTALDVIPVDLAVLKPRVRAGLGDRSHRRAVSGSAPGLFRRRALERPTRRGVAGPRGAGIACARRTCAMSAAMRRCSPASTGWKSKSRIFRRNTPRGAGGVPPTVHVHLLARLGESGDRRILGQFEADATAAGRRESIDARSSTPTTGLPTRRSRRSSRASAQTLAQASESSITRWPPRSDIASKRVPTLTARRRHVRPPPTKSRRSTPKRHVPAPPARHAQFQSGLEIQVVEIAAGEVRRTGIQPKIVAVPDREQRQARRCRLHRDTSALRFARRRPAAVHRPPPGSAGRLRNQQHPQLSAARMRQRWPRPAAAVDSDLPPLCRSDRRLPAAATASSKALSMAPSVRNRASMRSQSPALHGAASGRRSSSVDHAAICNSLVIIARARDPLSTRPAAAPAGRDDRRSNRRSRRRPPTAAADPP